MRGPPYWSKFHRADEFINNCVTCVQGEIIIEIIICYNVPFHEIFWSAVSRLSFITNNLHLTCPRESDTKKQMISSATGSTPSSVKACNKYYLGRVEYMLGLLEMKRDSYSLQPYPSLQSDSTSDMSNMSPFVQCLFFAFHQQYEYVSILYQIS